MFWNSLILKPHQVCLRVPRLSPVMLGDGVNLKQEDDRGKMCHRKGRREVTTGAVRAVNLCLNVLISNSSYIGEGSSSFVG